MSVSRVPSDPDMKREIRKFLDETERRVRIIEDLTTQLRADLTTVSDAVALINDDDVVTLAARVTETEIDIAAFATSVATTQLHLTDGITAPTATVGLAKIFVDAADGDLKVIYGDGVLKVIVADT